MNDRKKFKYTYLSLIRSINIRCEKISLASTFRPTIAKYSLSHTRTISFNCFFLFVFCSHSFAWFFFYNFVVVLAVTTATAEILIVVLFAWYFIFLFFFLHLLLGLSRGHMRPDDIIWFICLHESGIHIPTWEHRCVSVCVCMCFVNRALTMNQPVLLLANEFNNIQNKMSLKMCKRPQLPSFQVLCCSCSCWWSSICGEALPMCVCVSDCANSICKCLWK